jgi:hypothetical protein
MLVHYTQVNFDRVCDVSIHRHTAYPVNPVGKELQHLVLVSYPTHKRTHTHSYYQT